MAMRLPITYLPRRRRVAYPLQERSLLPGLRRRFFIGAAIAIAMAGTMVPPDYRIGLFTAAALVTLTEVYLALTGIRRMLAAVSLRLLTARRAQACLTACSLETEPKGNQQ